MSNKFVSLLTGIWQSRKGGPAQIAKELGTLDVQSPVAAEVYAQWPRAVAEHGADADIMSIVKSIERAAGARIMPEAPDE